MRYSIIIILGLVGLLLSCEKEMSPAQADKFIKFYGNYLMDEARDVEVLENGGYAICGTDSTSGEGKRMVLILTDEYGNQLPGFPKYYTEEGLESGANVLVPVRGGQGGFLLGGYVEKDIPGTLGKQKDMFLVKVSSSGQETWQRSYGSSADEVVLHATERISSGFLLAGSKVTDGNSDLLIMGVAEEGDSLELGLNYNNPNAEKTSATHLLNTGDRYLCVCTIDKIIYDGTDIVILNFNDEMDPFPEYLSGDSDEYGMCIIEDGPESFLVLGNRINLGSGRNEMVIYRIETDGLLITRSALLETITESNADLIGKRFTKTADGRYAIVGTRRDGNSSDIFLKFLTSDYSEEPGLIVYGGSEEQTGADIDLPSDGGILLLGTSSVELNSMISLIKTSDTGDL